MVARLNLETFENWPRSRAGLFLAYFLHFPRFSVESIYLFTKMPSTITHPSSRSRVSRRTHQEVLYSDFLKYMQKMDDAYALAKIKMAEFELSSGKCRSYSDVESLIYDLEN